MSIQITRLTPSAPDREGYPELHAIFDVMLPGASLTGCKLLRDFHDQWFMVAPFAVKVASEAIRAEIIEAALDALDEIDPES